MKTPTRRSLLRDHLNHQVDMKHRVVSNFKTVRLSELVRDADDRDYWRYTEKNESNITVGEFLDLFNDYTFDL